MESGKVRKVKSNRNSNNHFNIPVPTHATELKRLSVHLIDHKRFGNGWSQRRAPRKAVNLLWTKIVRTSIMCDDHWDTFYGSIDDIKNVCTKMRNALRNHAAVNSEDTEPYLLDEIAVYMKVEASGDANTPWSNQWDIYISYAKRRNKSLPCPWIHGCGISTSISTDRSTESSSRTSSQRSCISCD